MSEHLTSYDPAADAAYVTIAPTLGPGESAENVVIERPLGTVVLDFDRGGRLLGVEVLGARALLSPETIRRLGRLS